MEAKDLSTRAKHVITRVACFASVSRAFGYEAFASGWQIRFQLRFCRKCFTQAGCKQLEFPSFQADLQPSRT